MPENLKFRRRIQYESIDPKLFILINIHDLIYLDYNAFKNLMLFDYIFSVKKQCLKIL